MTKSKVTIIGAGFVGSTAAHFIADRGLCDVVLLDRNEGVAKGKALDLSQAMPIVSSSARIFGTSSYAETKNSEIVVITAGVARKPGMSRDDLMKINAKIVDEVSREAAKFSPKAIFIVVTNPLDAMVYVAWKATKAPPHRVIGMAGILDAARMKTFIASELNVASEDVSALVLGGHGDTMVPLVSHATVGGVPLSQLMAKRKIDEIVKRTQNGGAEIVSLLQTGSAYFAPGAAVAQMVEAIVKDQKRILPCAAHLDGEYGEKGLFAGVPVVLGKNGVEKIIEMKLSPSEKKAFKKTAQHVRELCAGL